MVRSRFCMLEVPPTSGRARRAPDISAPSVGTLRPVGTASSTARLSTTCCTALWTSTVGVPPVTVMLSSSEPTRMSALICAVKLAGSSRPSRTTVLKPGSEKVTV